jgi:hypothetical protein
MDGERLESVGHWLDIVAGSHRPMVTRDGALKWVATANESHDFMSCALSRADPSRLAASAPYARPT